VSLKSYNIKAAQFQNLMRLFSKKTVIAQLTFREKISSSLKQQAKVFFKNIELLSERGPVC